MSATVKVKLGEIESVYRCTYPLARSVEVILHHSECAEEVEQDPTEQAESVIRCKDCKYFEYDHFENIDGIPLIVGHEMCTRWGDGCKTNENGYCFLAERSDTE